MEQMSLFETMDHAEELESPKEAEQENTETASDEIEVTDYTDEQKEILDYVKGIISESLDPWCPLGIYRTKRMCFRIDFTDRNGTEKTVYTIAGSREAAEKSIKTRKDFNGARNIEITDIDEESIPEKGKILQNPDKLFSFKLDLSLSSPKWFSIAYRKKYVRIQVVFNPNDRNLGADIKEILNDCTFSMTENWCNFDTESISHEELIQLLHKIRPILKARYIFLYNHRLVEPCCCELQSGTVSKEYYRETMGNESASDIMTDNSFVKVTDQCCIDQGQCLSKSRNMQMKCSFRKLMEREGRFTKPAKYKGY